MNKIIKLTSSIFLLASVIVGCSSTPEATPESINTTASTETQIITIGASLVPHAEILKQTESLLQEKGYELKIVEYTDYILPNTALDAGDLDANFFQHSPYLDEFNAQNNTDISSALAIHFEPLGIYSQNLKEITSLTKGAKIAVPNDATNEARALLLLEAHGIITLADDAGVNATKLDIVENPYEVEIIEMEAAQLPRILPDVDLACINGNYALQGGLTSADAIAFEASDSLSAQTYANILAVNTANLEHDKTKVLVEVLRDESIRSYIEEHYDGAVVPVF